jgi:hypothetical protein
MIYSSLQVTYGIYISTTYLLCFLSVSTMDNILVWTFARCQQQYRIGSWGRVVSLAVRLWAGWSGVEMPVWTRDDSLLQHVQTCYGPTQPPSSVHTGLLSLGVKWPGHEVNQSPPSSTKVKNEWSYTCAPSIHLCAVDGENFIFIIFLILLRITTWSLISKWWSACRQFVQ